MSPTATVTGTLNSIVTIPIGSSANAVLAQKLLDTVSQSILAGNITPYLEGEDPPAGQGELVVTGAGFVSLPANTTVVADNATVPATFFGGTAAKQLVVSGTGGINYFANSGVGTVIAGGGNNFIVINPGSGNHFVRTDNGDDQIIALSGNNTIGAGLGHNLITLGSGNNVVDVTGFDTVGAGSGNNLVNVQAGAEAIVSGGSGNLKVANTGLATVFGGTGSSTIFGPGGGEYHGGSDGNNELFGGGISTTLFGGGSGDLLVSGIGNDLLVAGAGNETLLGNIGNDTFRAGSGNDSILAGSGADTLVAGTGNATMFGGGGTDTFVFQFGTAGGHVEIQDFTIGTDKIALQGYGAHAVSDALKSGVVTGTPPNASLTLTLSDNTTITFDKIQGLDKTSFN